MFFSKGLQCTIIAFSPKLGKTHQNVLVFVKGDPKRATEAVRKVDAVVGNG